MWSYNPLLEIPGSSPEVPYILLVGGSKVVIMHQTIGIVHLGVAVKASHTKDIYCNYKLARL